MMFEVWSKVPQQLKPTAREGMDRYTRVHADSAEDAARIAIARRPDRTEHALLVVVRGEHGTETRYEASRERPQPILTNDGDTIAGYTDPSWVFRGRG